MAKNELMPLIELITDIAVNVGALIAEGVIEVEDSRELNSNIFEWAMEFKHRFNEAEDYISAIDEYAQKKAVEFYGKEIRTE